MILILKLKVIFHYTFRFWLKNYKFRFKKITILINFQHQLKEKDIWGRFRNLLSFSRAKLHWNTCKDFGIQMCRIWICRSLGLLGFLTKLLMGQGNISSCVMMYESASKMKPFNYNVYMLLMHCVYLILYVYINFDGVVYKKILKLWGTFRANQA